MGLISTLEPSSISLHIQDYRVTPLNPSLGARTRQLERELRRGVQAYPDLQRRDFYDVELGDGWTYIHVHHDARTVFIVSYFGLASCNPSPITRDFGTEQREGSVEEMSPEKSSVTYEKTSRRNSELPQFKRMVPADASRFELVADALSRSFQNEPRIKYTIPDEQVRQEVLPYFFRSIAIPVSRFYGQFSTTETMDGGALWIGPGCPFSFQRLFRSAMPETPITLRWTGVKRCVEVGVQLDQVRRRLVRKPHWYLMAFGVEPSRESEALRGALIEPVLAQADSDALPCYVETFLERAVPFYEARGFRVEGVGNIPDGGPNFWAMIRRPRR